MCSWLKAGIEGVSHAVKKRNYDRFGKPQVVGIRDYVGMLEGAPGNSGEEDNMGKVVESMDA